ncbi:MAG: hypothetical protein J3K34DRAFT_517347 [Monoraphidium minutum]|nr:MAG: hypothetical protein J3K34DRAFT_517347 [Monoraphidium minutum]
MAAKAPVGGGAGDGGADAAPVSWRPAERPWGGAHFQDCNFTLEASCRSWDDEAATGAAEALAGCFAVADASQPGGPLVHVSAGLEALSGFAAAELLGRPWAQLLQPAAAAAAPPRRRAASEAGSDAGSGEDEAEGGAPAGGGGGGALAAALEGRGQEAVGPEEASLARHDGRVVRLLACAVPVLGAGGAPLRWLLVVADFDDRAQRAAAAEAGGDEQHAARWGEQVRALFGVHLVTQAPPPRDDDAAGGGGAAAEGDGGACPVVAASPGAAALTGVSQDDLAGRSCLCLAGPNTAGSGMRKLMALQLSGTAGWAKLLLYRRDGAPFWALVHACPFSRPRPPAAAGAPRAADVRRQSEGGKEDGGEDDGMAPASSAAQAAAAPPQAGDAASARSSSDAGSSGGGGGGGSGGALRLLIVCDVTGSRLKRLGKYVVGRVIGQGASGVVRMGRNPATDELVAIKTVDATRFRSMAEIEQVQEETAVLSGLKHPNIIRLLEVHFMAGVFYFVMEYAEGGPLVRRIYGSEGGLPEEEAQRIFLQITSALEYCHNRRVVHRDLKPENILMDDAGNIKIADFGLAAVTAPDAGALSVQCGTPEFTAPEIVGGREYDGQAVDLWSLGVLLYEALSGELPFKGGNQGALGAYPPLPPRVGPAARDMVRRLLTVDPAQRMAWDELNRHPWVAEGPSSADASPNPAPGVDAAGAAARGPAASAGGGGGRSRHGGGSGGGGGALAWDDEERRLLRSRGSDAAMTEVSDFSAGALSDDGDALPGSSGASDGRGPGAPATSLFGNSGGGGGASRPGSSSVGGGGAGCSGGGAWRGGGLSFTGKGCHESVRVVIPDRDDPITAAIMRSAESFTASPSRPLHPPDGPEPLPSPRARSFSVGMVAAGGLAGGGRGAAGGGSPGGGGAAARAGSKLVASSSSPMASPAGGRPRGAAAALGSLPPLSPSHDGSARGGGGGGGGTRDGGGGAAGPSGAGASPSGGRSPAGALGGDRRGGFSGPADGGPLLTKQRVRSFTSAAGGGGGGVAEDVLMGPDGLPLSRRQQKKLAKAQRIRENKEARKAADKEKREGEKERKRAEAQGRLAGMTEEERAEHEQRRKAIREAAVAERVRAKEHTRAALQAPLKLVIDLDFEGLMTVSEVKSLVSQVNFSYGLTVKGDNQAHLHLLGARGYIQQQMRAQIPHLDAWALTVDDRGYAEFFKDRLRDVVYLTADSPNELDTIDTSKVYIIGGIVDRNRHKRICLERAEAAGVAHARLPIQKHMQLSTSAVITVNQVVDLLVRGQGPATDWAAALAAALPTRKVAGGGGGGGGSEGGGEEGGGEAAAAEGEARGAAAGEEEAAAGGGEGSEEADLERQGDGAGNGSAAADAPPGGDDGGEPGTKRQKV